MSSPLRRGLACASRLAGSQNTPLVSKRPLEAFLQSGPVEWLGEIPNCPPLHNPVTGSAVRKCRDKDNWDFYAGVYEMLLELRAAHPPHFHVANQPPPLLNRPAPQKHFPRLHSLHATP